MRDSNKINSCCNLTNHHSLNRNDNQYCNRCLTYHANGGNGGLTDLFWNQDRSCIVKSASEVHISKAGFSFIGWNTLENGTGTSYMPGQYFPINGDVSILYAQWAPIL